MPQVELSLHEEAVRNYLKRFSLYHASDTLTLDLSSCEIQYAAFPSFYESRYDLTYFSLFLDSTPCLRSFAIELRFRGRGYGRELYQLVEELAIAQGCEELGLLPRFQARGFWEKMGFEEYFNEMVKRF